MSLEHVRALAERETGLCVVATTRDDGTVHATVVNAGIVDHPLEARPVVGFVVRGAAQKLAFFRRRGRVSVTFRRSWSWAGVEGPVQVVGPDDPVEGIDVPLLLRAIFIAAGGSHEDWDEYDRVMVEERRAAVLLTPERILGVG